MYHFPQLAYKSVADNVLHSDHIWKVIIFPFIPVFLLPSWWSTRGLNSLGFLLVLLNLLVGRCGRRNSTPLVQLVPLVLMVAVLLVLIVVEKNMGQRSLQKCVGMGRKTAGMGKQRGVLRRGGNSGKPWEQGKENTVVTRMSSYKQFEKYSKNLFDKLQLGCNHKTLKLCYNPILSCVLWGVLFLVKCRDF